MDKPKSLPPPRLIAVVEDDAAVLNALAFALETEGFEVRAFRSAEAVQGDPDLPRIDGLVVDHRLPGEQGLDFIVRLRAEGVSAPAVLITTNPPAALRAQAARLKVPLVEKPLLGDHLFASMRALLGPPGPRAPLAGS